MRVIEPHHAVYIAYFVASAESRTGNFDSLIREIRCSEQGIFVLVMEETVGADPASSSAIFAGLV